MDAAGNSYEQESFTWYLPGRQRLASFVRLTVHAHKRVAVRVDVPGEETLTEAVPADTSRTLRVSWDLGRSLDKISRATYDGARRAMIGYWRRRIAAAASVAVPESVVMNAWRAALVQNLTLAWRYSFGNPYEEFSYPEALDVAQVMAEWGLPNVSRSIVARSLTQPPSRYPNWKKGERLLAAAVHYRLFRERAVLTRITRVLRRYVAGFSEQIENDPHGLLRRERYSSDIHDPVYGLHSQAIAWQAMRAIAAAWADADKPSLARSAAATAADLERGLRRAIKASSKHLTDGSLFVPAALLDGERPYASLTEARLGSYWNLVVPYALASGLVRPNGAQANGIFRYMRLHGSRLLGLVRAGAYRLYGEGAFPRGGTDEVYGNNVARFLADNGEADQLVLSFYGQLALAMAPGTFVGGEAASIAPLGGDLLRSAYLPPNSAANGSFLTKLRLMLVHETRAADGEPDGLELAFFTPRAWLEPGKRVVVRRLPTTFGAVSFELVARARSVRATLQVPRRSLSRLALRLRLPHGKRIVSVRVDGRSFSRFDGRSGTIDLAGRRGAVGVVARIAEA
jgi:hypothetical protein